ncbi:MAG TPA: efflux RND transporter permease subunit, partial [Polyangiaceae bacterium]|nr:efflux RND transporter permease subunit [Polyangiaceae bacterium]
TNLDRVLNLIDFGAGYQWELPARLVVLPEYFLQGVTTPGKGEHGIDSFMKKAIELDGPEMQALGAKAREYDLYIAGGGVVVQGWEQLYLRGVGLIKDIPDIERIVLESSDGAPVYLRDVADVVIGAEPRQGAVSRDGRGETVAGMIIMLKGENSRDVVSRVKDAVTKIQGTLPEGVRLNVFYDRTSLIEACIETVVDALLVGGIFVILVLFLFLAELRTALIVVLSLPLTFLVSFVVMDRAGIGSNLMSLGGLAFSVGMVVDGSIVVVENVRRHLAQRTEREQKRRVVAEALVEVARPVAFSILIIAVILVPLFTLQGIEGKMFAPLAATLLIALLVSLGVALTVVPVLAE